MSWNKPTTETKANAKPNRKPAPRLLLIAAAGVALAVVVALLVCSTGRDAPNDGDKAATSRVIKAVQPQLSTNKAEKPVPLYATKFWELDESKTNGFTEGMIRKWKLARRPLPKVMPKANYRKAKYEIFNHRSENAIAGLLMHKPGQGMIGTPVYGEKFEQDFLKSCEEPIIIDENDDDYSRSLKEQMKETKIELRQRMADGESLGQILLDTHKELQKLGQIRQSIEEDMRKAIRETAATEADVDDCFEAANMMLESKGLAPMRSNPILKKSLMHILSTKEAK